MASRTEQFFCPTKQSVPVVGSHRRCARFTDYGDAKRHRRRIEELRKTVGDD